MSRPQYFLFVTVVCLCSASAEDWVFPDGAKLEELWNDGDFTEGVAVRKDGMVFFSDILRDPEKPGQILQFDPKTGKTTVYAKDSGKSNGLFFTLDGRLLACCGANGGALGLCEITKQGTVKPLVERYQGKRLNSPNDLVVHPSGGVYFSDPRYIGPEPIELNHQSVYRYDLTTKEIRRVTTDIEKPNGVHTSPDGKTLYVAETNNGSQGRPGEVAKQGRMTLNAFPLLSGGSLGPKKVLVDFGDQLGTDGMTIAPNGNIFAAVRSEKRFGIIVYSPAGKELSYLKTPALPTNCCFGVGAAGRVLYVTAGTGLYRVSLD